jgi:two-component system cell cycle sensor histidine kinase/response regulator CckA
MRRIERREWWLWSSAVLVTVVLTLGLVSFVLPFLHSTRTGANGLEMTPIIRALVALVLLFDIYVVYQQLQIYRIRQRLLEREEVFRLITENAADMIAVVDGVGRRLYNSPAYARILGYSDEELRNATAFEQIHPDDRRKVEEAAAKARMGDAGHQVENRMRHKDGSWRTLESTVSAIRNSDGKVEKLVIVNRDITDRKRLEEQFRQVQKMEAIGRLSGGIAHDFNNLLGVIIGYSEILQENTDPNDPSAGCIDEVLRAGVRAASLTRQLLAFSRQQVLEPTVLDLNTVVSDMEKMLRRLIGEDVELNTLLNHELGRVKADQGQIEQVILNLAVNARDAMPNGGKLTIQTANITMEEVDTRRYPYPFKTGRYVLLTVADTGMGMDSATRARIFEPFFTTKEKGKGTGLGLATVYGVVKQSDGYIEVHSEPNAGTLFKIYLPVVEEEITSPPVHTQAIESLSGNETILLVEDEATLRILTRNILERYGYSVLDASNGAEACGIVRANAGPIQLLLTDVVMPAMNGRDLAELLLSEMPELKVLYMSGYTGQGIGQGVLPPGCHFLAKPFSRENLAKKVREALDAPVYMTRAELPIIPQPNREKRNPDEENPGC